MTEPNTPQTPPQPPPPWQPPPPQPPAWRPDDNMGRDAARGFLSGFAGCLGVGVALIFVIVVLAVLASAGHH